MTPAWPRVPLVGKLRGHSFSGLAVLIGMDYFYPETRRKELWHAFVPRCHWLALSCPLKCCREGIRATSGLLACGSRGTCTCSRSAGDAVQRRALGTRTHFSISCVNGSSKRKAALWNRPQTHRKAKAKAPRSANQCSLNFLKHFFSPNKIFFGNLGYKSDKSNELTP